MADVELLPCPFCGSAPRFYSEDGKAVCVLCGECGASSDFWHVDHADHDAKAASAWNTRAHLAPLQAEIEALLAEVDCWKGQATIQCNHAHAAEARAERLEEALREARGRTADLSAWLKSGNDVPADLPFVFRERWQKIAADIRALEVALSQEDRND